MLPNMNPRELVDHIRSGPAELVLNKPLPRFRRRTRSNPCDFNEFLQALQSSGTIRDVSCFSHRTLGISKDEWVLLLETLGSIKGMQILTVYCKSSARDFYPFQAFANTVKNARSLRKLVFVLDGTTFPRDPSGLAALASALQNNTGLQEFFLMESCDLVGTSQSTAFDSMLQALSDCPQLKHVFISTKFASANAIRNLLQLPKDTALVLPLTPDRWLTVANEIRQGRCHIKDLQLWMLRRTSTRSEATEAVKAVASAIREDNSLEKLSLQMENGYTDEAGVALAEALTVNKTLRQIHLDDALCTDATHTKASLGAQAYEALSAMLRVNTSLVLKLPKFKSDGADERLLAARRQMRIEQKLNQVGRGSLLLSSRQTIREDWVWALHDLSEFNVNESPAYQLSCLYSLLRLDPVVVQGSTPHLRSDPSLVQSSMPHLPPLRHRAYSM
jgi:hypothetical protein